MSAEMCWRLLVGGGHVVLAYGRWARGRDGCHVHHRVPLAVDFELKDVWAGVVAGDVQHPARASQSRRVERRVNDRLLLLDGPSQDIAVRVDDGAVAAVEPLVATLVRPS